MGIVGFVVWVGRFWKRPAYVCPSQYASVVRVKLDMDNLLVARSRNGDGGKEPDFNRCVDGSEHCVCFGVCQRDDEAG